MTDTIIEINTGGGALYNRTDYYEYPETNRVLNSREFNPGCGSRVPVIHNPG